MASVTVRGLSEETHRALKVRAAMSGRSTEAEIRFILENSVRPEQRVLMGDALAALGRGKRKANKRILRLIRNWLKAGVIEDGRRIAAERGTSQGAVITPPTTEQTQR